MYLLTTTLLLMCTAVCECLYEQKLTCPYTSRDKNLPRVWCKMDPDEPRCCTGFSFPPLNNDMVELDEGRLSVHDDGEAFTVSVRSLSMGDGLYWCGLMNETSIIIKLAEENLYSRSLDIVWGIFRWILFLMLVLVLIFTHIYFTRKRSQRKV